MSNVALLDGENWLLEQYRTAAQEARVAYSQLLGDIAYDDITIQQVVAADLPKATPMKIVVMFYHAKNCSGAHRLVAFSDFDVQQYGGLEEFFAYLRPKYTFLELVGTLPVTAINRLECQLHTDEQLTAKLHNLRAEHPQISAEPWTWG